MVQMKGAVVKELLTSAAKPLFTAILACSKLNVNSPEMKFFASNLLIVFSAFLKNRL